MRCAGLIASALLASACGRFGFAAHDESDAATATIDADTFTPARGGCTVADTGPFTQVGAYPASVAGFGVWVSPPNVLMADQGGGVHNLRFDGSAFTQVGQLTNIGYVEAIWGDDSHLYIGSPGDGLRVVDVDAAGALAVRASRRGNIVEARKGWSRESTLFVPAGDTGLHAFELQGSMLGEVGTPLPTMNFAQGAWADATYVYLADTVAFRVLAWDGATFRDVDANQAAAGYSRIWKDRDTLFVAHGEGVSAFRMVGTTLQLLDTFATATVRDVWSDGVHVFIAASGKGIYALSFESDTFTVAGQITTGGIALGVIGDGQYIYANDETTGLHAYTGFSCLAHD